MKAKQLTLTIAPEGDWRQIIVNNDEGYEFYQRRQDGPFEQEVSEGNYDIVVRVVQKILHLYP